MPQKRKAKQLTVVSSQQLTQNMLRLTLHGEDLAAFPADAEGSYFKFAFPSQNPERPVMRTYTVANFRQDRLEIDVDFMLHGSGVADGVAAPWAMQASAGDTVSVFGPGPATFINPQADWFLLAADMTALPALTANLSLLPADAIGYVVVEILSEQDQQELAVPDGIEVKWVVNPQAGSDKAPLHQAIEQLSWLEGQVSIWTACEFKTMKKIRQFYREEKTVQKPNLYISSYWKKGLQEEEHKLAKREDAG